MILFPHAIAIICPALSLSRSLPLPKTDIVCVNFCCDCCSGQHLQQQQQVDAHVANWRCNCTTKYIHIYFWAASANTTLHSLQEWKPSPNSARNEAWRSRCDQPHNGNNNNNKKNANLAQLSANAKPEKQATTTTAETATILCRRRCCCIDCRPVASCYSNSN